MTTSPDNKKIDELLDRARRIKQKADAATDTADAGKKKGDIVTDAKMVREGLHFIGRGVTVAKEVGHVLANVFRPVINVLAAFGGFYKKQIWDRFAYKHEKVDAEGKKVLGIFQKKEKTGEKSFSKKRAAATVMATFAAVAAITPSAVPILGDVGDAVRVGIDEAVVLPVLMATTGKHETIYASRDSQTSIDRNANTFQVRGAREAVFNEQNSIYYEVRPALVHSLTQGPLYNPRVVASAIPGGDVAKCEIFSYGLRDRFSLAMGFNPIIVKATCTTTSPSGVTTSSSIPVTVSPGGAGPG